MERSVFLITYAACLLYFVCAKRRFDALSMAFFGAAIYFMPAVIGYGSYSSNRQVRITQIFDETYVLLTLVLLPLLLMAMVVDARKNGGKALSPVRSPQMVDIYTLRVFLIGAVFFLLLTISDVGFGAFSQKKSEFNEDLGRGFVLFRNISLFGLISAAVLRLRKYQIAFLLFLLVELALGFRSFVVLGISALVWIKLLEHGKLRLISGGVRYVLAGVAIVLGFTVMKGYLGGYRIGGLSYVRDADYSLGYLTSVVMGSEPFVIMNNLNIGLAYNFQQPFYDFLRSLIAGLIPFAGWVAPDSVSRNFAAELFSEVDYGVAFSPWLDVYSAGGWLLIGCGAVIYSFAMLVFNRAFSSASWIWRSASFCAAISCCTYIHRNSVGYELTAIRRLFLIAVAAYMVRRTMLYIARRNS